MSMYFCYIVIISPLNRVWPIIWKTLISFTQGCFVPSLVKIGPVVLEKKMKIWKVYSRRMDKWTDSWQAIRKAHFQLRWAKYTWIYVNFSLFCIIFWNYNYHNQRGGTCICIIHVMTICFDSSSDKLKSQLR